MIDVHVYPTNPDDETQPWAAALWPSQVLVITEPTRPEAINQFIVVYNVEHNTNLTADDFRFIGPILCAVYILPGTPYTATAYSERVYSVTDPTLEGVKLAFITLWNAEKPETQLTDLNVDWTIEQV